MNIDTIVASFTDAWIETLVFKQEEGEGMSHLLQMRGLKQLTKAQAEYTSESHLLQMRGLKLIRCAISRVANSRIFYRCVD